AAQGRSRLPDPPPLPLVREETGRSAGAVGRPREAVPDEPAVPRANRGGPERVLPRSPGKRDRLAGAPRSRAIGKRERRTHRRGPRPDWTRYGVRRHVRDRSHRRSLERIDRSEAARTLWRSCGGGITTRPRLRSSGPPRPCGRGVLAGAVPRAGG